MRVRVEKVRLKLTSAKVEVKVELGKILARACGVPAVGRSIAGNDVVANTILNFFPSIFFRFPLSRPFQTRRPFWGPLAAILVYAGGEAQQAVSECPLRR